MCEKPTLILLAGGSGTRMQALTKNEIPKPLIGLGDESVLARCVRQSSNADLYAKIILAVSSERGDWNVQIANEIESLGLITPIVLFPSQPRGTCQAVVEILRSSECRSGPVNIAYGDTVFSDDAFPRLKECHLRHKNASLVAVAQSEISHIDKYITYVKGPNGANIARTIVSSSASALASSSFGGLTHVSASSVARVIDFQQSMLPESLSQMLAQAVFRNEDVRLFGISWAVNLNEPADVEHAMKAIGSSK